MQTLVTYVGPADSEAFERELQRDGFDQIELKTYGPMPVNTPHQHDFDVRGFVLDGEATITCDGVPGTYRKGDRLEVNAGVVHTEAYGPNGYRVLVGKRRAASSAT